jgi:hypothetical protein
MTLKTTDPVDGTPISASLWGHAVFADLSALGNIGSVSGISSPAQTINGTVYTNMNNWLLSNYVKTSDTSRLLIMLVFTCFSTGATNFKSLFGVNIDGVDYDIGFYYWNVNNDHRQVVCIGSIPGLTAGSKTIQMRAKNSTSPTPNTVTDLNDQCSIVVLEVP